MAGRGVGAGREEGGLAGKRDPKAFQPDEQEDC
jgi:hypothetical protein